MRKPGRAAATYAKTSKVGGLCKFSFWSGSSLEREDSREAQRNFNLTFFFFSYIYEYICICICILTCAYPCCIQARYGFRIIVNVKFHVFSFFFPSQAKRKSHLIFFFFFQFSIRGFQSLILILLKAKLSMHYLIVRDGTFISRGKLIIQWNFSFKNFLARFFPPGNIYEFFFYFKWKEGRNSECNFVPLFFRFCLVD